MKSVHGFLGTIFSVKLLKYNVLCLGTDLGLFIFNTEISYSEPIFKITFGNDYHCESFEYDSKMDTLYILSDTGEVRKTSLKSDIAVELENLDIFTEFGCTSMTYHKKSDKIIFGDTTGLWSFEDDNWHFLFKVRLLNILWETRRFIFIIPLK